MVLCVHTSSVMSSRKHILLPNASAANAIRLLTFCGVVTEQFKHIKSSLKSWEDNSNSILFWTAEKFTKCVTYGAKKRGLVIGLAVFFSSHGLTLDAIDTTITIKTTTIRLELVCRWWRCESNSLCFIYKYLLSKQISVVFGVERDL